VVAKMTAVFDSYWASGDFIPFDRDQFLDRTRWPGRTDTSWARSDRPDAVFGPAARAGGARARARAAPKPLITQPALARRSLRRRLRSPSRTAADRPLPRVHREVLEQSRATFARPF
jgi:hypothetical protein